VAGRRLAALVVAAQVVMAVAVLSAGGGPAAAATGGSAHFLPLAPERLLDTRLTGSFVPPDGTITLDVLGRGGVPTDGVSAVVINLTATETGGAGFVQALPTGTGPGGSSTLNAEGPGQTLANLAVVPLGPDGRIALYTQSGAHLVVDVLGAFVGDGPSAAGRYRALPPERLLDTRLGVGVPGPGVVPSNGTVDLAVTGHGGVPASGVSAVALNITMTEATADGYIQVVPTGGSTPLGASSNLNVVTGQTKANLVMVPVGADGRVTLYTQSGGHLIADVMGWFSDGSGPAGSDGLFVALDPVRLLDTRVDGRPGENSVTTVSPLGQHGFPSGGVVAVVGNATATEAAAPGFVQVLPFGQAPGGSSTLNLERAGQTLANAAVATLSTSGAFDMYTQSGTHLLFDALGYFTGTPAAGTGSPAPPPGTGTTNPPPDGTPPPPPPPPPPPVSALAITSEHDFLGLGPRLVFSTVRGDPQPGRRITIQNTGSAPRVVTGLSFAGPQAASFRLAPGTPGSFTLAPGESRNLTVEFRPTGPSRSEFSADLIVATDDPNVPNQTVTLGALNPRDFESVNEPNLATIVRALGYSTDVGFTAVRRAVDRLPVGDEIISPYWRAADPGQPVRLVPVARYVGRTASAASPVQWAPKGGTYRDMYLFAGGDVESYGGENQKLMPAALRRGGGTGDPTAFSPGTSAFGLRVTLNPSDDGRFFSPPEAVPPVRPHTLRFYPLERPTGGVVPNAWLVAHDRYAFADPAVNWDYQDEVFVLLNARPEHDAAPLPGSSGHTLEFNGPAGGVADRDGQGTGFTSVMAASQGTAYLQDRIDLDPGAGVLRIRSTRGTASGRNNNQANALQVAFDGTRGRSRVSARFVGPFTMSQPTQHQGIYVGPGEDGFMKLEVEFRNGTCNIVLYREGAGDGGALRGVQPISCNVGSVDLVLLGDPASGGFRALYAVNGGALQTVFGAGFPHTVADPMGFFSRQSRAGVIVSNEGNNVEYTATIDRFEVSAG